MAVSVARIFYKGMSLSLGAFPTRRFPTPFRSFCSVGIFDSLEFRREQFTPVAWESMKLAKEIAIELNQVYIQPECLVLSLLDLEEGIAKDLLVNAKCNLKSLEEKLLYILKHEPKTTDFQYWHGLRRYAIKKYYRTLENIGYYPYPLPKDSYLNRVKSGPQSCLMPLIWEGNSQMKTMGDKLMGEEHFILAYHKEQRYGRQVFGELNVRGRNLISTARAIRADLKKKNDHVK